MKNNFRARQKTKKGKFMSKLAIDGGPKVFFNGVQTAPDWPPEYPETAGTVLNSKRRENKPQKEEK